MIEDKRSALGMRWYRTNNRISVYENYAPNLNHLISDEQMAALIMALETTIQSSEPAIFGFHLPSWLAGLAFAHRLQVKSSPPILPESKQSDGTEDRKGNSHPPFGSTDATSEQFSAGQACESSVVGVVAATVEGAAGAVTVPAAGALA